MAPDFPLAFGRQGAASIPKIDNLRPRIVELHGERFLFYCAVKAFRFFSWLLWFPLGPGGFREVPGGPGKTHGYPRGTPRGLAKTRGPGQKMEQPILLAGPY